MTKTSDVHHACVRLSRTCNQLARSHTTAAHDPKEPCQTWIFGLTLAFWRNSTARSKHVTNTCCMLFVIPFNHLVYINNTQTAQAQDMTCCTCVHHKTPGRKTSHIISRGNQPRNEVAWVILPKCGTSMLTDLSASFYRIVCLCTGAHTGPNEPNTMTQGTARSDQEQITIQHMLYH